MASPDLALGLLTQQLARSRARHSLAGGVA